MGFEQKFSKKIYFNSVYKITRPTSQFWPILNFAKRQNLQYELPSIWMNASSEQENQWKVPAILEKSRKLTFSIYFS